MKQLRIVAFDDNLFFRQSVEILFEDWKNFLLVNTFAHANNVVADVRDANPDVVLMGY